MQSIWDLIFNSVLNSGKWKTFNNFINFSGYADDPLTWGWNQCDSWSKYDFVIIVIHTAAKPVTKTSAALNHVYVNNTSSKFGSIT